MPMASAFQALPPASFYGGQLPRPQLVDEGNLTLTGSRVEPPLTPNGALLEWAADAHWSMGGLSFQRKRMAGKIEGRVEKLRRMAEHEAKKQRKKEEEEERERRRAARKGRSSSKSKKGRRDIEEDWHDDDEDDLEDNNVEYEEEDEEDVGEEVEDDLEQVVEEEVAEEETVEKMKSTAAKGNAPPYTPKRRKLAAEVDEDEGHDNDDDDDVVEAEVADPKRANTRRRGPSQRTSTADNLPDGRRQGEGLRAAPVNTPQSGHRGSPVEGSRGAASSSPAKSSRPSTRSAGGNTAAMKASASASPFTPSIGNRVLTLPLAPIMLQDSLVQHPQSPEAMATKQKGRLRSPAAAVLQQQQQSPMPFPPESGACRRWGAGLKRDLAAAFDLVGSASKGSAVAVPAAASAAQQGSPSPSSPRRVLWRFAPQQERDDSTGLALGEPVELSQEGIGKASRLRRSVRFPAVRA